MGKDKKEDLFVRKVKDKGIVREKRKLTSATKLCLESHEDKTLLKHQPKHSKINKEQQRRDKDKDYTFPSTSKASTSEDVMEWECTDIQVINTIQEIRKDQSSKSKCYIENFFTIKVPKHSSCAYIHIVIDTNIFLSYLEIVRTLVDDKKFSSNVQICIPWMVLQELDLLKTKNENKGKLEIFARKAAAFILEQSSQNANFRLQTLDEFRDCLSLVDNEENADDKILQWCLKLKKEVKKHVCLLSNDIIFCTKATACGILSFQSSKVIDTLSSLLDTTQLPEDVKANDNSPPPRTTKEILQPNSSTNAPSKKFLCTNTVLDYFEEFVTPVLSQVVELEMKKVYEELWTSVVKIKPPWTFLDTLQCFDKHWIAVFSFVYSKDFKHKLEQLTSQWKKIRHRNYSNTIQDEDVETLIQTTICVLQCIKKVHRETSTSVERCVVKLEAFQGKQPVCDGAIVLNLFSRIWDQINSICGTLADVTGIPHNIVYIPTTRISNASEIEEGLRMLAPLLANMENTMIRFLEASEKKSSTLLQLSSRELSKCLAQAISQFGIEADNPLIHNNFDDLLIEFISDARSKQLVTNGIEQLKGYSQIIHSIGLKFNSISQTMICQHSNTDCCR